ncbi:sodium:proton exchanger [Methanocella sp. CWC-04]|uniref:Sodium:proton exchanger n=1 Tax=Methanooceanicella nereidis TaxID=2052831 RepID=A0AAP2RG89_9EURY|nr:cation:proton antiporter [Methanocella sp. CWC-04]MCD1295570.1 sodium:proton exchanger [Methanocella sp. CWC-04]
MEVAPVIFLIGLLVFLAHIFAALFSKTKIPDVLLLMIIGLFLGPILGLIPPEEFGAFGPVFATVTLIVILFQSGIDLRLDVLRKALRGAMALTVLNFLITMAIVSAIGVMLLEMSVFSALLLGSIVGGTAATVIIPLVSQLKMHDKSKIVLSLESALGDVICIVVAISFIEALKFGEINPGLIIGKMLASFILAGVIGIIGALSWSIFLNKVRGIQNSIFTTPAFVFIIYAIAEMLGYSGAIASLAFGITLGNIEIFKEPLHKRHVDLRPISLNETEKLFFSELVFLLKTFFFVYIGLSIHLTDVSVLYIGLLMTIILLILRIPTVWISIPKTTPKYDASIMAIMIPRGLAAAVLASIPIQQGIAGGDLIQSVTYSIILFSIIMNALMIFIIETGPVSAIFNKIFSSFGKTAKESFEDRDKYLQNT